MSEQPEVHEFTLPNGRTGIYTGTNEREVQVVLQDPVDPSEVSESHPPSQVALAANVALLGALMTALGVGGIVGLTVSGLCGLWAGIGTLGLILLITGLLMGL
jgi:predicted lipid-binding transport protein (Tim44 family)